MDIYTQMQAALTKLAKKDTVRLATNIIKLHIETARLASTGYLNAARESTTDDDRTDWISLKLHQDAVIEALSKALKDIAQLA